jgi:hypothetical protein
MFDATRLSTHPVDVGIRSEGGILGELSRRGYDVFSPFSYNHRYDFVIDLGDRFLKAQCILMEDVEDGLSNLRLTPPANNQRQGVRWASDYELGSGERALAALPPPRFTLASTPE